MKKLIIAIAVIVLFIFFLFVFRIPILRATGNYLIKEDSLQVADAIFVLSGDPYDRGRQAKLLIDQKYAPVIVATGENISHNLKALGVDYVEADLTRHFLLMNEVDTNAVVVISRGSSTLEEAELIANYSVEHEFRKIIVVSSLFHTRRVHTYFNPLMQDRNIELIVNGAPSSLYREDEWWKEEDGLIMVNNEYMKLLYYTVKY